MISVIAHRGASARFRENTVEAFTAAARLGADGVELDVRRSADDALVVHHDAVLPDGRAISNVYRPDFPDYVPTLDAALDACAGMLVNIEVKNAPNEPDWDPAESVARQVAALVRQRRLHQSVIVSSFTLTAIAAVKEADPAIATAWLTLPGYDQAEAVRTAAANGHDALNPHDRAVDQALVDVAHAAGLRLFAWTVDDPDRIRALAALGADGVITNVPDVARAALLARGG